MKAAAATTTATTTAISHSRSWAGQQTRLESVASSAAAAYVWRRHASDFLQPHTHTNNTIYTHTIPIPIHTQAGRRAITNSVCFGFSFDAGFGFGLPNDPFVSVSESHMQTGLMCSCQIEMCTAHAAFVQHPLPSAPAAFSWPLANMLPVHGRVEDVFYSLIYLLATVVAGVLLMLQLLLLMFVRPSAMS